MFQFILILKLSFKQIWLCCLFSKINNKSIFLKIVILYKFDALKFEFEIRKLDTDNFKGAGKKKLIS